MAVQADLERLSASKAAWARATLDERIAVLQEIRGRILDQVQPGQRTRERGTCGPVSGGPVPAMKVGDPACPCRRLLSTQVDIMSLTPSWSPAAVPLSGSPTPALLLLLCIAAAAVGPHHSRRALHLTRWGSGWRRAIHRWGVPEL